VLFLERVVDVLDGVDSSESDSHSTVSSGSESDVKGGSLDGLTFVVVVVVVVVAVAVVAVAVSVMNSSSKQEALGLSSSDDVSVSDKFIEGGGLERGGRREERGREGGRDVGRGMEWRGGFVERVGMYWGGEKMKEEEGWSEVV
jgi:hypothetical protein